MALGINNQGQVVGVSALNDQATPAQGHHAFLWTSDTGMQDLGALPGGATSVGLGINEAGDVVGQSMDAEGNPRGFLWHNGVMNDFNGLATGSSLYLLFAESINARGEIAGFGATEKGDVHGFVTVPVNGSHASWLVAESVRIALPEDVRKLVRERLPVSRFGRPVR